MYVGMLKNIYKNHAWRVLNDVVYMKAYFEIILIMQLTYSYTIYSAIYVQYIGTKSVYEI